MYQMENLDDSDAELERIVTGPAHGPSSSGGPAEGKPVGDWFVNRAKHIPVRLTLGERKYLRLIEAALQVSEYTDKIDVIGFGLSKAKRIVQQIKVCSMNRGVYGYLITLSRLKELCSIMSGLVVAADYKQGELAVTMNPQH